MTAAEDRDPTDCKVGRLVEAYGLDGVGDSLERRWTADGDDRASLRKLAEFFNRRLLRAALEDAGRNPVDEDVAAAYRVLAGGDASEGARTQKRLELSRDGVDVDGLLEDFVSHQAVHTYLTEYRGVDREDDADQVAVDADRLRRLRSRVASVAADAVDRSANADRISAGDVDVLVDVRVFCRDCGADYDAVEFLERGGCDCGDG
ncbi:MAG: rod-determining factor RdfA [Halobacterium sp.]